MMRTRITQEFTITVHAVDPDHSRDDLQPRAGQLKFTKYTLRSHMICPGGYDDECSAIFQNFTPFFQALKFLRGLTNAARCTRESSLDLAIGTLEAHATMRYHIASEKLSLGYLFNAANRLRIAIYSSDRVRLTDLLIDDGFVFVLLIFSWNGKLKLMKFVRFM